MQNNPNQTNQKDPDNRGLDGQDAVTEQLRTLWCSKEYIKITFPNEEESEASIKEIRELLDDSRDNKKEVPG